MTSLENYRFRLSSSSLHCLQSNAFFGPSTVFENYPKCLIWIFQFCNFSINVCPIKIDPFGNTVWPQCWMRLFLWFSNTVPKPILDLFVNRKGIWVERKSSLKKLDFCLLNQRKPTKSEEKTKKEKPQNKHPYGKKMVHHIHNISNHLSPKSWECNFFRWSSFK